MGVSREYSSILDRSLYWPKLRIYATSVNNNNQTHIQDWYGEWSTPLDPLNELENLGVKVVDI